MKSRRWMMGVGVALWVVAATAAAEPRFVRVEGSPGQYVVTDGVTGLVWQGCAVGQSGADCSGGSATALNWYEAAILGAEDCYDQACGAASAPQPQAAE